MEKNIILTMQQNKDIEILINKENRIIIQNDNRKIEAEDIYSLLEYKKGDIYTVESFNEFNIDAPVLEFFVELIQNIIDHLNQLSNKDNQDTDVNDEIIDNTDNSINENEDIFT